MPPPDSDRPLRKLVSTQKFSSKKHPGLKTGVLAVVEGVRFWVCEDATNEEGSVIKTEVMKPVSRLGGISYGRSREAWELERSGWEETVRRDPELRGLIGGKI